MEECSFLVHIGNLSYNKADYAHAIRCYTMATSSNSPVLRSDAYLNRALAYRKLGLTRHAIADYAEAIETSYRNALAPVVQREVLNRKEIQYIDEDEEDEDIIDESDDDQFVGEGEFDDKTLVDGFPGIDFFKQCSVIQNVKNLDPWLPSVFLKRCSAFAEFGDFINAMQDAQTGITIAPQNSKFWQLKAESALQLRQIDTALECAKLIEEEQYQHQTQPQQLQINIAEQTPHQRLQSQMNQLKLQLKQEQLKQQSASIPIIKAKCYWCKNALKEAHEELKNTDKESGRYLRAAFNTSHGRISEALYDDPIRPLSIFATRDLPTKLDKAISNRYPFLSHLLNGILRTFTKPHLYHDSFFLDINNDIINFWFHEVLSIITPAPEIDFGGSIKQHRIPKNFAPKLLNQALMMGHYIGLCHVNYRLMAASGLAILEISQLISGGKKNHNYIPTFDLVNNIVSSWILFVDPLFPIFQRRFFPNSFTKFEFVQNGVNRKEKIIPKIAQRVKDKLSERFGELPVDIQKPETILNFVKTAIEVPLENLDAKIYLKPGRFGTHDFGIIFGENSKMNTEKYNELENIWISILNSLEDGKPTQEIFLFIYKYLLAIPLLYSSVNAGFIIFSALLHAFFGLLVDIPEMKLDQISCEAILAKDFDEFGKYLCDNLKVKYVGNQFESVIETLPDMQYRTAILLDVPNDSNIFDEYAQSFDIDE